MCFNDDTISTTLNKVGNDTTTVEMYGTIHMFEDLGTEAEQWHDWVGDYIWDPDLSPVNGDGDGDGTGDGDTTNGDGDGTTGGILGFEIIAILIVIVVAILVIALTLFKRKK